MAAAVCHRHIHPVEPILIGGNYAAFLVYRLCTDVGGDREYGRSALWNSLCCRSAELN